MSQISHTALEQIRELARAQIASVFESWADRHGFPDFHDSERLLNRSPEQLTFDEVLSLALDVDLSPDQLRTVAARHTRLSEVWHPSNQEDWIEVLDRRPILMATYLSAVWIPALGFTGRSSEALETAEQYVTFLRSVAFRHVLGAGNDGRDLPDYRHSYRLMLAAPVLAALSLHISPTDDGGDSARELLETLFSGGDLSPCTAIWAPAVAYAAGIPMVPHWWLGDLSRWPNLQAAYELAEESRLQAATPARLIDVREIPLRTGAEIFPRSGSV